MKNFVAVAALSVISLFAVHNASAQRGRLVNVQFGEPPVRVMTVCFVNGDNYPVDFAHRIWGHDGAGIWAPIGRIIFTPNGPVAESFGRVFPAACN